MKVGLLGYSQSGRSTLFRAAAGADARGDVIAVPVPDPRFDRIVEQVKPKKATPASVIFHDDLEAVQFSGKAFSLRLLESARKVDLLLHVVRAFESDHAPFPVEIDPIRDQEAVEVETILADLQIVETRLEKLTRSQTARNPGSPDYLERVFFERVRGPLEAGEPLRALEMDENEQSICRNYQFLSSKPTVVVFNVSESEASAPPARLADRMAALSAKGTPAFAVCARIEEEIAQLDPADQPEFLDSLGLAEPAADRVIRAVYEAMGLITFFTAGENETRAWPLRRGSSALKAAATIHNDIAKGFIRAEVTHWEDYVAYGSLDAAEKAGKMTLEGRDYVVRDGDLLHIRNKS
ncbi:MAG: DUF933 domain-containing protein [Fimbriimonadaceae bacterium]